MTQVKRRRRYFVDPKIQGALLLRMVRYWLLSITVLACLILLGWIFICPGIGCLMVIQEQLPSAIGTFTVALAASVIVLPVIAYDCIRMTNRFVGPMYRLRRTMEAAANGQPVAPLQFREGDFWHEFGHSFNKLLERIERLEQQHEFSAREFSNPVEV